MRPLLRTSVQPLPSRDERAPGTLFITRKFPPAVGGMETLAANVWEALGAAEPAPGLIAHGGSVPATPLWLPAALTRLTLWIAQRRVAAVICGDALLYAAVGPILRRTGTPHVTMAMGLDVTYDSEVYRRTVLPGLRKAPAVLAISRATAAAVAAVGVPEERIRVVALGLPEPPVTDGGESAARTVREDLGLSEGAPLLLTLGRLVRRKGVAWFVSEVMPKLGEDVHYVVAGDGPDHEVVAEHVRRLGLTDRVHLLGRVSDERRELLLRGADLFVQPNIPTSGDMEGFGLAPVEAAMHGTLAVAADLEGLRDAVEDGATGYLVPSLDVDAWVSKIGELLLDRESLARTAEQFRSTANERNSLAAMERQLVQALEDVTTSDAHPSEVS